MTKKADCPSASVLEELIGGKLVDPDLHDLSEHLEDCADCQAIARTLTTHDTLVDTLRGESAAADAIARNIPRPLVEKIKQLSQQQETASDTVEQGADATAPAGGADIEFLSAPQRPDEIGRLGGYRVLSVLGKGGMGMVFLADDPELDRKVALKVMLPKIAANPQAKQRFLREARTAAKLKSDHIVTIYQVSEDRGVPFLAMEFLEGMPLDGYLRSGRALSLQQVLRIGREIARGLSAAHEKGLIHRDIKPANLWLDKAHAGRVKILDFGLARAQHDDVHITQSGAIVGTPAYMAPEQAHGDKHVDARADLFSLGCVLYRLCAGDIPFRGETTMGVLLAIATTHPTPPIKINDKIPLALSELIMQLLEKEPAKRPASAREVVARLQEIASGISDMPKTEAFTPAGEAAKSLWSLSPPVAPLAPTLGSLTELQEAEAEARVKQPSSAPPRRRPPLVRALAGVLFTALLLLAGTVFFWQTPDGVVRIECDDPAIKLAFDDGELQIAGVYNTPLSLAPGKHGLRIKRGDDFEFETDKFIVRKGDKIVLKIEVLKGKVQVVQGDKVIGAKELPSIPAPLSSQFALSFDGKAEVTVPTLKSTDWNQWTIEAYVTPTVLPQSEGASIVNFPGEIGLDVGKKTKWRFGSKGAGAQMDIGEKNVRVHLAGVYDEGRLHLFWNGYLVNRLDKPGMKIGASAHLVLGRGFEGAIGEVHISKTARYLKDFKPAKRLQKQDAETLALYQFEEGAGDKLTDSSGNGHHGKIVGAKWVKADETPPTPAKLITAGAPKLRHTLDTLQPLSHIAFSPDGKEVIATGWNLTFFDSLTGEVVHQVAPEKTIAKEKTLVTALSIAADGKSLAYSGILGDDYFTRVLDLPSRKEFAEFRPKIIQHSIALSPDGKTLAYDDQEGLMFHDVLADKSQLVIKAVEDHRYSGLSYSPDAQFVVGLLDKSTENAKVVVVTTKSREALFVNELPGRFAPWTQFSRDSKVFAAGGSLKGKPAWHLFDVPLGWAVHAEADVPSLCLCGAFSPNGAYLALGHLDGTIQIWDASTKKRLLSWSVPKLPDAKLANIVEAIAFSPDGLTLATATGAGAIHLWDLTKTE